MLPSGGWYHPRLELPLEKYIPTSKWKKKKRSGWVDSIITFLPKTKQKRLLHTQILVTCTHKRLENNFTWLVELWVIFICFLKYLVFSFLFFSVSQSSLYKRKKRFLFWKTKGDPPTACSSRHFNSCFDRSCLREDWPCSSSMGSPLFHPAHHLTTLQGSSCYPGARTR